MQIADWNITPLAKVLFARGGKRVHVKGEGENTKHEPLSPSPFPDFCKKSITRATSFQAGVNLQSAICNLQSALFQAGVNLQSTIGNLQSVDSQQEDLQISFWEWVRQHPEIPIILCEGEKKAACLLSLGFVAVALPGIWNGRVGKQDFDERLHPDIGTKAVMRAP
nr:DUF3854 domain-containing protein [Nostoc flagelliforme]